MQEAVRGVVLDVARCHERLLITHTLATLGWGGVLFVDVYARAPYESFEELDAALRCRVAAAVGQPHERVAIRWRTAN